MLLFAIAARAACAQPDALPTITQVLSAVCAPLMSPEREAAEECARMWPLFAKVAQLPKETLRQEAGRAFCRDLDALCQKLELPPLTEWVDLPQGLDEAGYEAASDAPAEADAASSLEALRARARQLRADHAGQKLPAEASAALVRALHPSVRGAWLEALVGQGTLSRTDVSLIIRFLAKGGAVNAQDTMLVEVLGRLAQVLADHEEPTCAG